MGDIELQDWIGALYLFLMPFWMGFGLAWDLIDAHYRKQRIADLQYQIRRAKR